MERRWRGAGWNLRTLWSPWSGLALACALLGLLGAGAGGCAAEEESAEEISIATDAGEVTVERDGETVRIEGEDGELSGEFGADVELPEAFAQEDVRIPEGVTLMGAMTTQKPGEEGSMVSLRSDDPPEDVLGAYRREMDREGWVVEEETSVMGWRVLRASKDGRNMIVQAMERDGGSHVMMHMDR